MPAATAAAEPEEDPPGECSRFKGLRVRAGVHVGKFGRHRLAHDHRPRFTQETDNRGVSRGTAPGVQHRPVLRRHIRRIDDVLHADGGPGKREAFQIAVRVQLGCLIAGELRVEILPGLDFALASFDSGKESGGVSRGCDLSRPDSMDRLQSRELMQRQCQTLLTAGSPT